MKQLTRIYHIVQNKLRTLLPTRTIGARMLLLHEGKVLLVKHTYHAACEGNWWYTIGGGVETGETPRAAMERELKEEVGAVLTRPPKLFSVYHNKHNKKDDYVVFFIGDGCTQKPVHSPEISEQQWFPLDALPKDISPATMRRIQEYLGHVEISERW